MLYKIWQNLNFHRTKLWFCSQQEMQSSGVLIGPLFNFIIPFHKQTENKMSSPLLQYSYKYKLYPYSSHSYSLNDSS